MKAKVLITEEVQQALSQLPIQMQRIVYHKIDLLAIDPHYRSLHTHQLCRVEADIWECYMTKKMRLLYESKGGILRLWALGGHSVVDKVHRRGFAPYVHFMPLESGQMFA